MSIAGVGSDKNGDPRPYGLGIMSFFTIMAIAGGVLLGIGATEQSSFAAFKPTTDFNMLVLNDGDPFACLVLNHTHTTDKRSNGRSHWCVDIYKYIFVDTTTNITYSSGVEEGRRPDYGECKTTDTHKQIHRGFYMTILISGRFRVGRPLRVLRRKMRSLSMTAEILIASKLLIHNGI